MTTWLLYDCYQLCKCHLVVPIAYKAKLLLYSNNLFNAYIPWHFWFSCRAIMDHTASVWSEFYVLGNPKYQVKFCHVFRLQLKGLHFSVPTVWIAACIISYIKKSGRHSSHRAYAFTWQHVTYPICFLQVLQRDQLLALLPEHELLQHVIFIIDAICNPCFNCSNSSPTAAGIISLLLALLQESIFLIASHTLIT